MAKSTDERRKHKRLALACPAALAGGDAGASPRSRTLNISDGGMLLPLPPGEPPARGARVEVHFAVPRSTPNTYMLESFVAQASVVRLEPADNGAAHQVALQFDLPLRLGLEV